jgi:hypothetical protein
MNDICRVEQDERDHDGGGDKQEFTRVELVEMTNDFMFDKINDDEFEEMLSSNENITKSLASFFKQNSLRLAQELIDTIKSESRAYIEANR